MGLANGNISETTRNLWDTYYVQKETNNKELHFSRTQNGLNFETIEGNWGIAENTPSHSLHQNVSSNIILLQFSIVDIIMEMEIVLQFHFNYFEKWWYCSWTFYLNCIREWKHFISLFSLHQLYYEKSIINKYIEGIECPRIKVGLNFESNKGNKVRRSDPLKLWQILFSNILTIKFLNTLQVIFVVIFDQQNSNQTHWNVCFYISREHVAP